MRRASPTPSVHPHARGDDCPPATMRFTLRGVSKRKGSTQTQPADWPGDPDGWIGQPRRSRAQWASLVRALLIAGLVFDGVAHREAIRSWVVWEMELSGPWSRRESTKKAWALLEEGRRQAAHNRADGPKGGWDPLYALREYEQNRSGSNRQLRRAIGIDPKPSSD
jgi:hypothetical protein